MLTHLHGGIRGPLAGNGPEGEYTRELILSRTRGTILEHYASQVPTPHLILYLLGRMGGERGEGGVTSLSRAHTQDLTWEACSGE